MLPASVQVEVLNDRTRTIRASLHEVEITLLIAIMLVVAVMALFLRQLSATADRGRGARRVADRQFRR